MPINAHSEQARDIFTMLYACIPKNIDMLTYPTLTYTHTHANTFKHIHTHIFMPCVNPLHACTHTH